MIYRPAIITRRALVTGAAALAMMPRTAHAAAHRYWRLLFPSGTVGGVNMGLGEVQMRTSVGGANVATGGTASASSAASGYDASFAFDGDPAPRYWRVSFPTGTQGGGSNAGLAEVALRATSGGGNIATGGTAIASSFFGAGFEASKAFDSNNATDWVSSGGATGAYIGYDLGSGNNSDVEEIVLTARATFPDNGPALALYEFSYAGSSWQESWRATPATFTSNSSETFTRPFGFSSDWVSAGSPTNSWIAYDFGAGNDKDIVEVTLKARGQYPDNGPDDVDVQYSDNGSAWSTAASFTGLTWTAGQTRTLSFPPAANARSRAVIIQ